MKYCSFKRLTVPVHKLNFDLKFVQNEHHFEMSSSLSLESTNIDFALIHSHLHMLFIHSFIIY